MKTQPGVVDRFILIVTGNRDDSHVITTQELTEYIAALFSLLFTAIHTGFD